MVFIIGGTNYSASELNNKLKNSKPTFETWFGPRKITLGNEAFKFNEILDAVGTTIRNQNESGQFFSNNDEVHSIFKRLVELKDQGHENTSVLYYLFKRFLPNLGRDRKIETLKLTLEITFPSSTDIKNHVHKNQSEFNKITEAELVKRENGSLSIYDAAQLIDYYIVNKKNRQLYLFLSRMNREAIKNLWRVFSDSLVFTRTLAESGNADAQSDLGSMYYAGHGDLEKSELEAVKWYTKAAEQGSAIGQYNLGTMYLFGKGGLEKSSKKAVELYTKAAEQGNEDAQKILNNLKR